MLLCVLCCLAYPKSRGGTSLRCDVLCHNHNVEGLSRCHHRCMVCACLHCWWFWRSFPEFHNVRHACRSTNIYPHRKVMVYQEKFYLVCLTYRFSLLWILWHFEWLLKCRWFQCRKMQRPIGESLVCKKKSSLFLTNPSGSQYRSQLLSLTALGLWFHQTIHKQQNSSLLNWNQRIRWLETHTKMNQLHYGHRSVYSCSMFWRDCQNTLSEYHNLWRCILDRYALWERYPVLSRHFQSEIAQEPERFHNLLQAMILRKPPIKDDCYGS